jgi:hypothetical protein
MSAVKNLIETFVNGNLADAKTQARRHSHRALREAYTATMGGTERTATSAADYLKGGCTFEEFCEVNREEASK